MSLLVVPLLIRSHDPLVTSNQAPALASTDPHRYLGTSPLARPFNFMLFSLLLVWRFHAEYKAARYSWGFPPDPRSRFARVVSKALFLEDPNVRRLETGCHRAALGAKRNPETESLNLACMASDRTYLLMALLAPPVFEKKLNPGGSTRFHNR